MKWFSKYQQQGKTVKEQIDYLFKKLNASGDFIQSEHQLKKMKVKISFIRNMIDTEIVHRDVLSVLVEDHVETLEDINHSLPFENTTITDDIDVVKEKIMRGNVLIQNADDLSQALLVEATISTGRQVSMPEVEFSVLGPKESFVEALDTNISLIRKRLPLPNFTVKEVTIGKITKSRAVVMYLDGLANDENVNTIMQRIEDIEYDQIIDSSFVTQMIADNTLSAFPQLIDTERPDRVVSSLTEGKIACLVDGSPFAIMGPTTLVEFFSAFDDYTLNWYLASTIRLIRLIAVAFSVLATPLYVAILTYHYQLIPENLMATLISSRMGIPFPPILEAFFMEITIEILREAGVRLPTKVGQTIGIVGGIVIGTASVQANITSNVLLIIVAMAALASFTTPNYKMNNTVRLIRFPFLIFAGLWGMLGIAMCFAFIVAHLLKLTSLGRPYIEPFFPFRIRDLKDAFIRLPFSLQNERPILLRPKDAGRINSKRTWKKHDIDE